MNDFISSFAYFGVMISMVCYGLAALIRKKTKCAVFNPLLFSIIFVMIILIVGKIDYTTYFEGAKYLQYLLTPATVCLAIPLYEQIATLKKHYKAILGGILSGAITSMGSVFALSKLFHFTHEQYVTLLPKSVTTAIGMGISEELGGYVTITVAVILVTGVFGNIVASGFCKLFRITHPVAQGIAIGSSAHAMGTVRALEIGEVQGAMSSLSVVVSGLITVVGASIFALLM